MLLDEVVTEEIIAKLDQRIAQLKEARALLGYEEVQPKRKYVHKQKHNQGDLVLALGRKPSRFSPEGQTAILAGQAKRWKKFYAAKRAATKQQKSLNASMA